MKGGRHHFRPLHLIIQLIQRENNKRILFGLKDPPTQAQDGAASYPPGRRRSEIYIALCTGREKNTERGGKEAH